MNLSTNTQYVIPSYCRIEEITNKEALKEEDVTSPYVLFNNKTKCIYFINESIKYFLDFFKKPLDFNEFFKKVKQSISLNDDFKDEDAENKIKSFFDLMIKRGFVIPLDNNEIRSEQTPFFSKYEIIETIKSSNGVQVCLAIDKKHNSKVILKFLMLNKEISNEQQQKRKLEFNQEFRIMEELSNHPLVCELIKFDKENNLAVIKYINGLNLKDAIKNKKLKFNIKLKIIKQIAEVMSFMHKQQIIHGDIHAKQFMLDSDNNIHLIDFGFSLKTNSKKIQLIKRGGVHYYLEPENITPNAFRSVSSYKPSFRSEVYRIGALIYFLIYEEYPFSSFSWKILCKKIKTLTPELHLETTKEELVPKELRTLLKILLSKNPDARFESAIQIQEYLKEKNIKL